MPEGVSARAWQTPKKEKPAQHGNFSGSLQLLVAYLVNITARAERDLTFLYEEIDAVNSASACSWFRGLERAILSLERLPLAWPLTPESRRLRHLLYGRRPNVYRVIYRVLKSRRRIDVLHIRHGARDRFKTGDLR